MENFTFGEFKELRFTHTYADGVARQARVAVPDVVAPCNHWVYIAEFYGHPDAATTTAYQFLADGWYVVTLEGITDKYGCPAVLSVMKEFHDLLVANYGLRDKCVMMGASRGGLYSVEFALAYPDIIAGIYLDAPVQDMCSWPGGHGLNERMEVLYADGKPAGALRDKRTYTGFGSRGKEWTGTGKTEWQGCVDCHGYADEDDMILNDNASPIYHYDELIAAGIPVLLQISTADGLVPYKENGLNLYKAYQAAGKTVRTATEPGDTWLRDGEDVDCAMILAERTLPHRGGHVHGWHTPADTTGYVCRRMQG